MATRAYEVDRDYRRYTVAPADAPLVSTGRAGRVLGVSGTSVVAMVKAGRLPATRGTQQRRPRYLIPEWAVEGLARVRGDGSEGAYVTRQDIAELRAEVRAIARFVRDPTVESADLTASVTEPEPVGKPTALEGQLAASMREAEIRKRAGQLRADAAELVRRADAKLAEAATLDVTAESLSRDVVMTGLVPDSAARIDGP
jgi:hypothetical protein